MTNFLEDLEEDERILNNQKRVDIEALQNFANKLKEDIETTNMITWDDEEKVNEIRMALSRQDSVPRHDRKKRK